MSNQRNIYRNEDARSGSRHLRRRIARVLLCLMLTVTMIAPAAMPADVFAAKSTSSSKTSGKSYSYAKTQYIAGINVVFSSSKVISNERLKSSPTYMQAAGKRRSIKLSWTGVSSPSSISGYIIVMRDKSGNTWRQIATVKAGTTSYTDKKAKTKNRYYRYSVLAYKKIGDKTMVSGPAGWAGAVTTRSKKKNVYSVSISNPANVSVIMAGSCAQTYLKFPKKAKSKYIRWWSGNESVATVDNNGLVRGVNPGTAVIYCKTHTGSVSSFTTRITKPGTAQAMIDTFYAWNGYSRINGKHKSIIDIYNSVTPWPAGYKMRYTDAWCDASLSAATIKSGNVNRIGRECSVPRHIKIFKSLGIWQEDGTITPRPGDIIVYSWSKFKQPNNASASHIGLVVSVNGNQITCLEGNRGIGVLSSRTIPVGWGCIRGYAQPKYAN